MYFSSDIDECSSTPCHNGGICSNQINGYTCLCSVDFTGVHCETGNYKATNKIVLEDNCATCMLFRAMSIDRK